MSVINKENDYFDGEKYEDEIIEGLNWFNPHMRLKGKSFDKASKEIFKSITLPARADKKKNLDCLKDILSNLFICFSRRSKLRLGCEISIRKAGYRLKYGHTIIERVVRDLKNNGYIEVTKGFYSRDPSSGTRSKVREVWLTENKTSRSLFEQISDSKLVRQNRDLLEMRLKKNRKSKGIARKDQRFFKRNSYPKKERDLRSHYKLLRESIITINGRRVFDLIPRRIYNNSNIKNGGRIYHWFTRQPEEARKTVTINDHKTVELDYSALHFMMAYAEIAKKNKKEKYPSLSFDPYQITGFDRKTCKIAANIIFNCSNGDMQAKRAIEDKVRNGTIGNLKMDQVRGLIDAIVAKNKELEKHNYFFSGKGLELQNKDSDLAMKIINHFGAKKELVISIHDSFIIREQLENELRDVMIDTYRKKFKQAIKVS